MKVLERDELLIRMDERQKQILDMNIRQESHLQNLNSKVADNVLNIATNRQRLTVLEKCIEEGVPIRMSRRQILIGGTSISSVLGALIALIGKWSGWW